MQRECEQKEGEVRGLVEERGRLQATVKGLEREVAALRWEVNHRDDIIRERVSNDVLLLLFYFN